MERIPEPELMDEAEQARAYAEADFAEPHEQFVALFRARFPAFGSGRVLDLGCGPADVTVRFARALPGVQVDGLDGAPRMLAHGRERIVREGLDARVRLFEGCLPAATLPDGPYDALISNSLLHHLHEPQVLWAAVRAAARPGTALFVMDLLRPATPEAALALVTQYAAGEPEVLRRDFHHSLHAAFRPAEVEAQLAEAGIHGMRVEQVSDRHLLVSGVFR